MNPSQQQLAGQAQQLPVEYVGPKGRKTDTITGSAYVWEGPGTVVMVPRHIAERLFTHPSIWRHASDFAASPPSPEPKPAPSLAEYNALTGKPAVIPPKPVTELEVITALGELLGGETAEQHLLPSGEPKLQSVIDKLGGRPVSPELLKAAWHQIISTPGAAEEPADTTPPAQ